MTDNHDILQEIKDKNGDPDIISFINHFRNSMKDQASRFIDTYDHGFADMLLAMFPNGKLVWEPSSNRTFYANDRKLYDINGLCPAEKMLYIPDDQVPPEIRFAKQSRTSVTLLQIMDIVESYRDYIRRLFISSMKIRRLHDVEITPNLIARFAEQYLQICPDNTHPLELLYNICVSTTYTGRPPYPDVTFITERLTELENHPKQPYFCEHKSEKHKSGGICIFRHTHNSSVRCIFKTSRYPANPSMVTAIIQLTRTEEGFSWQISKWFNYIKGHGNEGLGKLCLKYLAEELQEQYGKPVAISYIWNGQNDFVGRLVTDKWGGVCNTPAAVLKNDCADSWDSHIYDLDRDRFMDWLK